MNVKYRAEFTDDVAAVWRVDILKAEEEQIVYLELTGDPINFSWFGADDPFSQPVQGSSVEIKIWNYTDFSLLDLFTSNDFQFKINVYCDDELFWTGYKLSDSYSEKYNQAPHETVITGVDGLGLLRNFQFKELEYTSRTRISQIIYDILGKINIESFIEIVNIYKSGMSSGEGDSPFDQLGIDPQLFQTNNLHEVLESILLTFNAGIKQDQGDMYIYRFCELANDTLYCRKFTGPTTKTAFTLSSVQNLKRTNYSSAFRDMEGGTMTMIPKASLHIINYDFGLKESALRNWDFHYDDFVLDGTWSIPGWGVTANTVVSPLSVRLPGEEKGIYVDRTISGGGASFIHQTILNVKTRSPQFSFSFEFNIHNRESDAVTNRAARWRLRIVNGAQRWYNAETKAWVEHESPAFNQFFQPTETIPDPSEGRWYGWQKVEAEINGVPFDGDLTLELSSLGEHDQDIGIVYRDVKLVMTPLAGGEETGIGYTYPAATRGRIIERDHILGDGFNSARHAVNQLLSYSGILNLFDGSTVLDPLITGGLEWSTRGNAEAKSLLEVINDELGSHYINSRQLIDIPVWSDGEFIFSVGAIQDTLNKVGEYNRMFLIMVRNFRPRSRDYDLTLAEIIGYGYIEPDPEPEPEPAGIFDDTFDDTFE